MNMESTTKMVSDPYAVDIDSLDFSDGRLFETGLWNSYFERLRNEDPVHYQADSPFGPFWSITRFDDIMFVDKHHELFSSEPAIVIGDMGNFITIIIVSHLQVLSHPQLLTNLNSLIDITIYIGNSPE